jgi:hypothetical protein
LITLNQSVSDRQPIDTAPCAGRWLLLFAPIKEVSWSVTEASRTNGLVAMECREKVSAI